MSNGEMGEEAKGGARHGAGEGFDSMFALSLQKSNDESFPVLKAFQEFLESERERARRRQLALTLAFMGVIVTLVLVFCVIGIVMFNGLMNQNAQQQGKLLELLMQRPQGVAEARVAEVAPVQAEAAAPAEPDPALAGLMELVKELRAEIAISREAGEKQAEALAQANARAAEEAAKAKERDDTAKRTGIISQIKPRGETQPQATDVASSAPLEPAPAPAPAQVAEQAPPIPATESAAVADPAPPPPAPAPVVEQVLPAPAQPAVTETPVVPEVSAAAAPAAPAPSSAADSGDGQPTRIQVKPAREMRVPDGYKTDSMSIVTEGRQRVPWRIVMPIGESGGTSAAGR